MGQNRSYIHFAEDTQQTKTLWIIQNIRCFSSLILKSRALKKKQQIRYFTIWLLEKRLLQSKPY